MGKPDALSASLNAREHLFSNDSLLIDDLAPSTLQIVFQRLDHLDLATVCYEHACAKFPNKMELMMGLFNCYVRDLHEPEALMVYVSILEQQAKFGDALEILSGNGITFDD
ncbi:hypothetical protein RYX36_022050 [Vicia faba]